MQAQQPERISEQHEGGLPIGAAGAELHSMLGRSTGAELCSSTNMPKLSREWMKGRWRSSSTAAPRDTCKGTQQHRLTIATRRRPPRRFRSFAHLVSRAVQPNDRILILGNGNSDLPFDLRAAGFAHVTASDRSPVANAAMELKAKARASHLARLPQ